MKSFQTEQKDELLLREFNIFEEGQKRSPTSLKTNLIELCLEKSVRIEVQIYIFFSHFPGAFHYFFNLNCALFE